MAGRSTGKMPTRTFRWWRRSPRAKRLPTKSSDGWRSGPPRKRDRDMDRPAKPLRQNDPMPRHRSWLFATLALVAVFAVPAPASASSATRLTPHPWIGVKGNHLVDGKGNVVRLLGVNRSGFEYSCVEEGQIIEGPTDWASVQAMKSWHINAVRLPLNESCWLGTGGAEPSLSGANYRGAVHEYV